MSFDEDVKPLVVLSKRMEEQGYRPAAIALQMAILKLRFANYCAETIPARHAGGTPEGALTEACVYFLKATLDCAAEAVSQRYELGLPEFASTETFTRLQGVIRRILTVMGEDSLADRVVALPKSNWYGYLKWLRDLATHRGLARYDFHAGGPTYLQRPKWVKGKRFPVQDDLERLIRSVRATVQSWAQEMVEPNGN